MSASAVYTVPSAGVTTSVRFVSPKMTQASDAPPWISLACVETAAGSMSIDCRKLSMLLGLGICGVTGVLGCAMTAEGVTLRLIRSMKDGRIITDTESFI